MASRTLGLVIGGGGLVVGIALAVLAPPPATRPRIDPGELSSQLESRLRETAAGVHSRVTTLADLPRLAAAVSTDAATVADLTKEELAFRPKPGESITIAQIPSDLQQKPMILSTMPAGAAEPGNLRDNGARLVVMGETLSIVEVVPVVPRARADELTGAIAVTWPVDTTALATRLDAVGASVRIEMGSAHLSIGKGRSAPSGSALPLSLATELAKGARVVADIPLDPAGGLPLKPIGVGLALTALLLGGLLARRKETPAALAAAASPRQTSPGGAVPSGSGVSAVGTQVGRYTIVRRLGSGGMAEVFLARASGEAGFEKLVALKVLHREFALQPVVVEHFLDEARLASRLIHPNIVQIDDLGKAGDEYFIAMEYIEGADLERLLASCRQRGEAVPLRVALAIVRKICDGLHAAHIATAIDGKPLELVHRDVKSANVFVAKNGVVKVGDFGIAKANVESRITKTEIGMVKGTAAYMAPEHRLGQPLDRRADLYAVGAIAYELLSGQEINLDLAMLADKGRQGWPHLPKLSEIRPDLPSSLDDIVFRCLAYDKADRYPDCGVLEEALEQVAVAASSVAGDKVVAQWVEAGLAIEANRVAAS